MAASSAAAPSGVDAPSGLRVNNSLNPGGEKTPFSPSRPGEVTWYICGPTVYDVAHVGHARTYLAFDIIRRILEDYFGYNVFYVMNVTDVDDKIIARARGNYLLDQYFTQTTDPAKAVSDVLEALGKSISSSLTKVADLKAKVEAAATQKLREDMEEQLGEEQLKLKQKQDAQSSIKTTLGPASCSLPLPSSSSSSSSSAPSVKPEASPNEDTPEKKTEQASPPSTMITPGLSLLLDRSPSASLLRLNTLNALSAQSGHEGRDSVLPGGEGNPSASVLLANGAPEGLRGEWESAVEQGREALAGALVAERGSSITDLSIFRRHAALYEKEFLADMKALGVRPPHVLTRVTEYIEQIIKYVEQIVGRGLAYESNGSVYFDTRAFSEAGHVYGKLCPWAVDNTERAAEGEANFLSSEKKHKSDFALWKKSKAGEPSWESPWGQGRPGWHIECSAMASDIIGEVIDIHSGGIDLRFPHHSNELAQAEAFHNCHEWVRYFLHTGHLHIEGRKMSKSLKNFITIRQALETYSARQIRMLFLMQAWDKNMNFGHGALEEATKRDRQFKLFFQTVDSECRGTTSDASSETEEWWGPPEKELNSAISKSIDNVRKALEDNFDTAGALLALLSLISAVNVYISTVKSERGKPKDATAPAAPPPTVVVRPLLLRSASDFVARTLQVFGLNDGSESNGEAGGGASDTKELVAPFVRSFAAFRDSVRAAAISNAPKEELLSLTDRVRDFDMVDLGIRCEDRAGEATALAELDDPLVLKKERDERLKLAAQEAAKKLRTKHAARLKELQKWEAAEAKAADMFRSAVDKYSAWDAKGIPTHDAAAKELSGKARKGVEKEHSKQADANMKLASKLAEEPSFLQKLKEEVANLEAAIAKAT